MLEKKAYFKRVSCPWRVGGGGRFLFRSRFSKQVQALVYTNEKHSYSHENGTQHNCRTTETQLHKSNSLFATRKHCFWWLKLLYTFCLERGGGSDVHNEGISERGALKETAYYSV